MLEHGGFTGTCLGASVASDTGEWENSTTIADKGKATKGLEPLKVGVWVLPAGNHPSQSVLAKGERNLGLELQRGNDYWLQP